MKIVKIDCPACGASLNATEDDSRVICEFCGGTVVVEDSKQEGFNHELGAIKARASVSDQLANTIDELTDPLCSYSRVVAETDSLKQQLASFEKQLNICETKGKAISIVGAAAVDLLVLLILIGIKASVAGFVVMGLIAAALFPIIGAIVLQYTQNMIDGISDTTGAVEAHEKTIKRFDDIIAKHSDITIPDKYRTPRAMQFISEAVRGQRANTIDHAMAQYDDLLMKEKSIALQEEQIRLQQEQISETKKIQKGGGTVSRKGSKSVVVIKQRGHSIIWHLILLSVGIGFITIPYYTLSKRHYWHL